LKVVKGKTDELTNASQQSASSVIFETQHREEWFQTAVFLL